MKYLQGLAKVASDLGVKIFENTKIIKRIVGKKPQLISEEGVTIKSNVVLLCGNAYLENINTNFMNSKIAKVTSSVLATKPIDEKWRIDIFGTFLRKS